MYSAPKIAFALSALALVGTPAPAACWNPATYQAAQVRELDTMLTVGAMRCLADKANFAVVYNGFVQANATALKGAGETLRSHFATEYGADATGAYRTYLASATDHHLSGKAPLSCEELAAVAKAAAVSDGPHALARFAQSAGLRPKGEEKLCRDGLPALQVAARR